MQRWIHIQYESHITEEGNLLSKKKNEKSETSKKFSAKQKCPSHLCTRLTKSVVC